MDHELIIKALGLTVVASPVAMLAILGIASLIGRPLSEKAIGRTIQSGIITGLLAALTILGMMLFSGSHNEPIEMGNWVEIPDYHFVFKFEFDRLSVPFVILTFLLCGTIGAFGNKYMHREKGFNRFFVFYTLFVMGMVVTSLAGTIETLFFGWELVGLSSALLVAFYQERPAPVRNGLHVWTVYRISDAALLLASIAIHRITHTGDFASFLGESGKISWPEGVSSFTPNQALGVGLLFLLAAAGKSAMVPFSGWLPRAMEGPTPSSAVFYGAMSVHLGAFLLLRFSPLLYKSPLLCAAVVVVGLTTAVYGAFTGRVQTDIKSALSFASLTQVGIIFAEIGCGLRYIALIHILGHACFRTLQFLRAPSLLHDYSLMENAVGARLPRLTGAWQRLLPERFRDALYRLALERGYLDACLIRFVVAPFLALLNWCHDNELGWTKFISGDEPPMSEPSKASSDTLENLL